MVAAPWVPLEFLRNLCAYRIVMNVFRKNQKISIAITENDLTSALEKMTYGSIFSIEVHRIALIDSLKYLG